MLWECSLVKEGLPGTGSSLVVQFINETNSSGPGR